MIALLCLANCFRATDSITLYTGCKSCNHNAILLLHNIFNISSDEVVFEAVVASEEELVDSMSHRPRHMLPKCSSLGAGAEERGLVLALLLLAAIVYNIYIYI